MKNTLLSLALTLTAISAQAGAFKQVAMRCKATAPNVVSELRVSVQELNDQSVMSTLATVNGAYCNIDSAKLNSEDLQSISSQAGEKLFSKKLKLSCYSSQIADNALNVVLNIDSAKNSVNLIYVNEASALEVIEMNCTKEGFFKRLTDSLKFPEIGS